MRRFWVPAAALVAMAVAAGQAQPRAERARFHHVHLNTHDRVRSVEFYELLGALPVTFAGRTDAIFTGRGFILATEVDAVLKEQNPSGIPAATPSIRSSRTPPGAGAARQLG